MKNKKGFGFERLVIVFLAVLAVETVAMLFYNKFIFAISAIVLAVVSILFLTIYNATKRNISLRLMKGVEAMSQPQSQALDGLKCPVLLVSWERRIMWANRAFGTSIINRQDVLGRDIYSLIEVSAYEKLLLGKSLEIAFNDKYFKVFVLPKKEITVVYFIDQTSLRNTANEYKLSRPVVAILEIDALDEVLKDEKGSKKIQVRGAVQDIIEKWFHNTGGIIQTLSNTRFLLMFEERHLKQFEDEKFSLLENIRNYEIDGSKYLTVSIGIGHGCNGYSECEKIARKALDMALSRGGDQVAIKGPQEDYKFYGGVKAVTEKGSRVRTRVTAKALSEMIGGSSNVLIMGHKFSDLDSLGAAFGIAGIVECLEGSAKIVVNREQTMAKSLLDYLVDAGKNDLFVDEKTALGLIEDETLLIVVDTHRPNFVESNEVYKNVQRVVVIDHHRKATDFIDNALLFYNETTTSSTCEIVTELWQYMGIGNMDSVTAEALLSGIMLDTKSFVLGTGVKTYEAAAYLRKCLAQPVTVKKLFSDSFDVYKGKYEVISSARHFEGCAIAVNYNENQYTRIVSAQAADELLGVQDVKASFVMFNNAGKINISARSYGEYNVQLIMEKLGGGGHKTMAACTVETNDFGKAETILQTAIKEYLKDR